MTIISSLVSGTSCWLELLYMIKAFGALAAGTPDQAALQQVFLKRLLILQQVLELSCSNYLLQFLYQKLMI
jgi:hypothetical protein